MKNIAQGVDFIEFSLQCGVLKLGQFVTKAGRLSPYFFNAGLFSDGASLAKLAKFYADCVESQQLDFDMIFGPAYKGIPLAAALAMEFASRGRTIPFAFNRKETKDHGEGGNIIGAPLAGKVLVIDDVISAGTSLRESLAYISGNKAEAAALVVCLDRMEKGQGELSAIAEARQNLKLTVFSIATLDDLLEYLRVKNTSEFNQHIAAIEKYRQQYGA